MKKPYMTAIAILVVAAVPLVSAGGQASDSSRQPLRIAYVDLDRVAANSKAVKAKIDEVEKDLRAKQAAYADKAKELKSLRAQLRQRESVMSKEQIGQIQGRIVKLSDDLKYLEFDYGKTLDNTSRNLIEPVLDDVLSAVSRVAGRLKIDLVLRGDLVLFSSDRVDITDVVIRELDQSPTNVGAAERTPGTRGTTGKRAVIDN